MKLFEENYLDLVAVGLSKAEGEVLFRIQQATFVAVMQFFQAKRENAGGYRHGCVRMAGDGGGANDCGLANVFFDIDNAVGEVEEEYDFNSDSAFTFNPGSGQTREWTELIKVAIDPAKQLQIWVVENLYDAVGVLYEKESIGTASDVAVIANDTRLDREDENPPEPSAGTTPLYVVAQEAGHGREIPEQFDTGEGGNVFFDEAEVNRSNRRFVGGPGGSNLRRIDWNTANP